MVKIWFDIVTSKESWLFGIISKKFEENGFETIITVRDYDNNVGILDIQNLKYSIIGSHGGKELKNKLVHSLKRSLELTEFISNLDPLPDYCVTFGSPESSRVAFGLGIKLINVNDTPHAEKVAQLTVPLSDFLITPKSVNPSQFIKFGISKSKIIQYNGIDEITWLKDFKPNKKEIEELGISNKGKFIVYRIIESKSAYFTKLEENKSVKSDSEELLKQIIMYFPDLQIIVLSRYEDQKKYYKKRFGDKIIIPKEGVNGPNLSFHADLVISGGGTMNREAALLGTPAICFFPLDLEVNEFVIKEKFPLWHEKSIDNILTRMKEILKTEKRDKKEFLAKINQYDDVFDALITIF